MTFTSTVGLAFYSSFGDEHEINHRMNIEWSKKGKWCNTNVHTVQVVKLKPGLIFCHAVCPARLHRTPGMPGFYRSTPSALSTWPVCFSPTIHTRNDVVIYVFSWQSERQ